MGGGDLNLKKSWAVNIQANQKKVWLAEKKALDERRRVQELQKEREEERAVEELRRLQMEAGGKATLIDPKVAWMYQDAKGETSEASEAYLLGKRRVDQIILKQDTQQEESKKTEDPLASALSARDISSKAALDPLLAIEKQRTANLQALMSDPIARRRLMKDMSRSKEKEDDRKERRHRRDRNDDHEGHRSKRRKRYSDNSDDDRLERRRHRDDSSDDKRERRRSKYGSEDGERGGRRYRDDSRAAKGERRGDRDLKDEDRPERRRYHDEHDDDRREHKLRREHKRRERSRSRSPYRPQRQERPVRDRGSSHTLSPEDRKPDTDAEERAAKLAAMSANADDLEDARNRRLAEMEAREAVDRVREDKRRDTRGDRFVNNLRDQAESRGLADRLQRASGGLAKLESGF
jgi:hypothetical protein